MENLIKSKDVREYIEKIGYKFSDLDIAKLIAQRVYSMTSKNEKLKELESVTSDQKLKEKIRKKIEKDNQCILKLQTPAEDELFMMEIPYEDDDGEYREYFFNFEDALTCASESGNDFYIKKIAIHRNSVKWDEDELDDGVVGYLDYRNGEIFDYWCPNETEDDLEDEEEYDEEYDFRHCEVEIPHQFKQPDIIRVSGTDEYGIVVLNYERDICEIEGVGKVCMSDSITVELVDDDMLFTHAHINPDELEYANLSDDHPLKGVLEAAGYVVEGRGYIQALQIEAEKYLNRMKKK